MDDLDIFEEIVELKKRRRPAVLATVVDTSGSTPRKAGARMLVRDDGTTLGTVGGGPVEAAATEAAPEVLRAGQPRTMAFRLTEEEGYVCGGQMRLFLEPLTSSPRLVIVGNGHIGQATGQIAGSAGFGVEIVDWVEDPALPEIDSGTSIVVATREHHLDFQAVAAALRTDACFIGLIGSVKKRRALAEFLLQEGFSAEATERIDSPVGLEIGAETPMEIAISIVAQLIKRNRGMAHEDSCDTSGSRSVAADGTIEAASASG